MTTTPTTDYDTKEACAHVEMGTPPSDSEKIPQQAAYENALTKLDIEAVKISIREILTRSDTCWPADGGHYGPLFVRLAWHCAGTYRKTDGKGGCHGGRIRFEPERSWGDNTHLDKARALLYPVKQMFGDGLSWGDLIIAAGTVAMEAMGLDRKKPLCFGRMDDENGLKSEGLLKQDDNLGPTKPGLIYVEPDGPKGHRGDLIQVAEEVKETFRRMGADFGAAVALIGGGHAFGKAHGACQNANVPGDTPQVAFAKGERPWLNVCNGGGVVTSEFEGYWTTTPTKWSNEFFSKFAEHTWERRQGPGGNFEWRIINATSEEEKLMRLTADMVLWTDPELRPISEKFASNPAELTEAFDDAWFKLTTNGDPNRWAENSRCDVGDFPDDLRSPATLDTDPTFETKEVCEHLDKGTPPSDFEEPPERGIYETALGLLDIEAVKMKIADLLKQSKECWPADGGHYGPLFVRLAWHCAGTYRKTDGKGGCHGGRIRFEPERSWGDNTHLDKARALLYPVKQMLGDGLSWGDLIIAAGTVAMDEMGLGRQQPLCFGRMDEKDGSNSTDLLGLDDNLAPTKPGLIYVEPDGPQGHQGNLSKVAVEVKETFKRMGANFTAAVALIGGGHAFGKAHGACQSADVPGDNPQVAFAKGEMPWLNVCNGGVVVQYPSNPEV